MPSQPSAVTGSGVGGGVHVAGRGGLAGTVAAVGASGAGVPDEQPTRRASASTSVVIPLFRNSGMTTTITYPAVFTNVSATDAERGEPRAGDDLVVPADVVMDRAFTVPGDPTTVWPWIVQLGKWRAGWYLPARFDAVLPRRGAPRSGSSTGGSTSPSTT